MILMADPDGIRLQKVLAAAGVGSRRACEEMIAEGRVSVDGRIITEQGTRVDPERQAIAVDGMRVATSSRLVLLALNKPPGVLSAMSDARGRPCVGDYVAGREDRLFHVGRLDSDSEGLLLLTNDGQLAHHLAHPSHGVAKTYLCEVPGPVPRDLGRRLRAGVELDDGMARVDSFKVVAQLGKRASVEVVLHEGRNRIVRRMFAAVDMPVAQLVRTAVGPVRLGNLAPGRMRPLTARELGELYAEAGL